jgi:hypothetical protein
MAEPVSAGRAAFARIAGLSASRGGTMRRAAFALGAALMLASCTSDYDKGYCPDASILAPTSILTVFRAGAPADPSGELYTVWMNDVKTGCDFDKHEFKADSRIHVRFKAKRAAGGEAGTYRVPYFVAITHKGNRIMTKKLFVANVSFGAGETSVAWEESIDSAVIKFARGNKIGEYAILTGFQLTQAQLDYNIKMHHYAP